MTSTQPRILVGTRKGLFEAVRGAGDRWRIRGPHFLGDPVTMVLPDDRDGTLYAALNLGHFGVKLHRLPAGARTWEPCATPEYPPQPQGAAGPAWKLVQIWSMETGGKDEPGSLWAGTLPGGLFRSPDGARTWELVRGLWDRPERPGWFGGGYEQPGIHSICVDPRASRTVSVAISSGGVWRTRDGGDTWEPRTAGMRAAYVPPEQASDPNVQDPHRMRVCAAHPDVAWIQHHNGIFRSDDDMANWREIDRAGPSTFGFAVAVHPLDPGTAWFVPAVKDECRVPVGARMAVTRTRDGGRSFEVLRRGLPQRNAYDLVYRHALDVCGTGERLAMGSTTGALWVSEDGGERWRCIAPHLPPIACVRFG